MSNTRPQPSQWRLNINGKLEALKFQEDHRRRLHPLVSRFLGFRPPDSKPPYDPLPIIPFVWLRKIPLQYEIWITAWIGSFTSIILIEAIMSTSTAFRDAYHAPIIITSFGASAVLLFGPMESPLAQPRNLVLGHFVSALAGVAITRLFARSHSYVNDLSNVSFQPRVFVNGGLSMATSLLAQLVTGNVHPPGGATGLNAAVQEDIVRMSWTYVPSVIASSLIMLGWALIMNNLGRRRYPIYWWSASSAFVRKTTDEEQKAIETPKENPIREDIDPGRAAETLLVEQKVERPSLGGSN